jgi:phosphoglycolate phosphatase
MPISNVLFDLDGTLTEPAEGITRCYQFALEGLGLPTRPRAELLKFIGPPMRENFRALLATDDAEMIERAVALYRERYAREGWGENKVYPGVREALAALKSEGFRLYVATSKTTHFAVRILEHFLLAQFLVAVHGATPDGSLDDKALLVARLLEAERLDPAASVMVGDREHDIRAARGNGVRSVGVTYGYGSRAELEVAGADFFCDTPTEIVALVRRLTQPAS